MKKLLLFAVIAISLLNSVLFAKYSGGSGTAEDPWQISCPNDLIYLGSHPVDYNSCFILTADVNLADYTFTAAIIAPDINNITEGFQGTAFTGIFDGNGFTINHLIINKGGNFLGLFGMTDSNCVIKNLGIADVNIIDGSWSYYIGGLVGYNNYGSIYNCYTTVSFDIGDWSGEFGGLAGVNSYGTISNCYSVSKIFGRKYTESLGGLVGVNNNGSINECYSTGIARGDSYVGGLVGDNNGIISKCHSTSEVRGGLQSNGVGGLVGCNDGGSIEQSYATGKIRGDFDSWGGGIGGLVGQNINGSINECYSANEISGKGCVGGLAGLNEAGIIKNCYTMSDITTLDGMGYVSGDVGGLVGENDGGNINQCYSKGIVVSYQPSNIGGLVGNNSGVITRSYSTVEVIGRYYGYDPAALEMGGLVGLNDGPIGNCFASGDVNVGDNSYCCGGLVGGNSELITDCYSTGHVIGGDNSGMLGGLIGENYGSIVTSYSTGKVTSGVNSKYLGGLTGYSFNANFEHCYFLHGSGPNNGYGEPLRDLHMMQQSSFVGWDFVWETTNGTNDLWAICENVYYPRLAWQFTLGDFDNNKKVDFIDFAQMALKWLDNDLSFYCGGTDLNGDSLIDSLDLHILAEHWLEEI